MAAPAVRRADFLMALAYATDLATGHSRDFALRSCVLAMRLADVAGLDQRDAPQRLSPGAAALHRLQCRHASAGGGVRRRDRASPRARIASTWATRRNSSKCFVRAITRKFRRRAARGTGRGGRARSRRGAAGERPDPVRPLRGRAADRRADRPAGRDPRKSRPDLRALGRQGIAATVSRAMR